MPVGLNFGSVTSGNGFDVASTVSSIMALQRTPETSWKSRITTLQAQDTVLTTLGTHLSNLSASLSALTGFDGVLSSKSGSTSDSSVAITSADITARAGTHSLLISRLAQVSTQYSSAVGASDTLSGSISIQVGDGSPTTINLDSTNNTLASLAASLNAAQLGVTATVVSGNDGARLSLVSNNSGAGGQITLGGALNDGNTSQTITFTEGQQGRDAEFVLDGISMTSPANTVQDAIPGVTLQLLNVSTDASQIEIVNDTSSVSSALNNFVTAYNQIVDDITAQEGKDSSGNAEPLYGSTVLSNIHAQLSSALGNVSGNSGSIQYLAQLGVTVGVDGKLAIDNTTLNAVLNGSFTDVQSFFQTVGNFGQSLLSTLTDLGSTSTYGAVNLALAQNSDEENRLNANVSNLEAHLADYEKTLTSQLTSANQILQSIPQQLDQIKELYDAISGKNS